MKKFTAALFVLSAIIFSFPQLAAAELKVGDQAPDFTLTDINGKSHSLSDFNGKYRVLEWTNPECPFVVKHYSGGNMQGLQKAYTAKGVVWLSVNSSAKGKQGSHTPEEWKDILAKNGSASTALLLDGDGKVGKQYGAQTTPHMYIIDPSGKLIYQGAIDDKVSTDAGDIAKSKNYVSAALDEALAGQPVSKASTKAYGCSVKY